MFWVGAEGGQSRISTLLAGSTRQPAFLDQNPNHNLVSPMVLSIGEWHHLAFVYDGEMKRIYIDGEESVSDVFSREDISLSGFSMGTNSLPASMDEFRVYGRALTAEEVKADYNDLR